MRVVSYLDRYAGFVRDVATMMSGKATAAAIALFTTPIVGRLFEPSDFGIAAVFASIVGITSSIAALRFGSAIVLPKQEAEALQVVALSHRMVLAFCTAMFLIIAVLEISSHNLVTLELLGLWVWFLPLGTLLTAAIRLQDSWLTRCRSFGTISASLVAGNSTAAGSRIAAGLLMGTTVFGLIIGHFVGMLTRIGVQWRAARTGLQAAFGQFDMKSMKKTAIQYSDFPLFNAPAGLIFALGQNLPVLLFGSMFSPAVAGLYAMASRFSRVPVEVGASAMRRVFLQRAANVRNSGRPLSKVFLMTVAGLAALGIAPLVIVLLFGEPILTWLLGPRWSVAGRYVEIIAPWMFMLWIMSPCNAVFIVLRKQKFWLSLQSTLTTLRLGAFGLAYAIEAGPEWTLGAFVIATIAGNLMTMVIAIWLTMHNGTTSLNSGILK